MAHLERIGPDVCITYLEHIIHHLGEEGAEFHERLIELYLAQVHSPNKSAPTLPSCTSEILTFVNEQPAPTKRTRSYLTSSNRPLRTEQTACLDDCPRRTCTKCERSYSVVSVATKARSRSTCTSSTITLQPRSTFVPLISRSRSLTFSRCRYCKRVYESDPAMRSTIFHLLLRIYLRPRPNHPLLFTPALSLISAHASSIDAIEVFDLLPPLVALSDIKVFLQKTLRRSGERAREAKIVKGIGRSWVDAGEREVVELEERRVKITDARVCVLELLSRRSTLILVLSLTQLSTMPQATRQQRHRYSLSSVSSFPPCSRGFH